MVDMTADPSLLSIPVDPEHAGIRFGVIVLFVVFWLIGYAIANTFMESMGFNLVAALIGFGVAALAGRAGERYLKTRWPSGRSVQVDQQGIRINLRDKIQQDVKAGEPFSVLLWRFKVNKRGRVPKGWYVIACALEQDDRYLPVYSFASPEQSDNLNKTMRFPDLMSEKAAKNVKQDMLRVAGEQRRLRLAEEYRWNEGAEMAFEDFQQFLESLKRLFPQWMP